MVREEKTNRVGGRERDKGTMETKMHGIFFIREKMEKARRESRAGAGVVKRTIKR